MLVKLTSRAWSLDILSRLHAGTPGRQAPLLAATGAGRTAFTASLQHLIEIGLLERNPGHGHPLRPEYRLTERGHDVAPIASRLADIVGDRPEAALLRRTWTVPILAVTGAPRHFNEIKADLASITDRSLSKALQDLEDHGWIRRTVDVSLRPLRPTYQAIGSGARINRAVSSIVS
ncbi:winged helix-turn-helix transcriptional regulator [Bauldia sp.]|uniref:winged helix-turn-helix transcriptional regulator n=1 Tax=Bauldia sp. TaxID=2575872 RepID=UPI003BA98F69